MCLAIPGEIIEFIHENSTDEDALLRPARVRFGGEEGITKEIYLAYLPEAKVGDFVLVHVGFAISQVDLSEAKKILETLDQLETPVWEEQMHEPSR